MLVPNSPRPELGWTRRYGWSNQGLQMETNDGLMNLHDGLSSFILVQHEFSKAKSELMGISGKPTKIQCRLKFIELVYSF